MVNHVSWGNTLKLTIFSLSSLKFQPPWWSSLKYNSRNTSLGSAGTCCQILIFHYIYSLQTRNGEGGIYTGIWSSLTSRMEGQAAPEGKSVALWERDLCSMFQNSVSANYYYRRVDHFSISRKYRGVVESTVSGTSVQFSGSQVSSLWPWPSHNRLALTKTLNISGALFSQLSLQPTVCLHLPFQFRWSGLFTSTTGALWLSYSVINSCLLTAPSLSLSFFRESTELGRNQATLLYL